jgi:hypothetical protein
VSIVPRVMCTMAVGSITGTLTSILVSKTYIILVSSYISAH